MSTALPNERYVANRYRYENRGTVSETCDRVQQLLAGRRAGMISIRQFKAEIEKFTNAELARLAATLLETDPGRRKHLERSLRLYGEAYNNDLRTHASEVQTVPEQPQSSNFLACIGRESQTGKVL